MAWGLSKPSWWQRCLDLSLLQSMAFETIHSCACWNEDIEKACGVWNDPISGVMHHVNDPPYLVPIIKQDKFHCSEHCLPLFAYLVFLMHRWSNLCAVSIGPLLLRKDSGWFLMGKSCCHVFGHLMSSKLRAKWVHSVHIKGYLPNRPTIRSSYAFWVPSVLPSLLVIRNSTGVGMKAPCIQVIPSFFEVIT